MQLRTAEAVMRFLLESSFDSFDSLEGESIASAATHTNSHSEAAWELLSTIRGLQFAGTMVGPET